MPTGCDADGDGGGGDLLGPAGAATPRDVEDNGFRLNGFRLNGFRLNGFRLNGFRLNSADLDGEGEPTESIEIVDVDLKGNATVDEAWLEGSKLQIIDDHGALVVDKDIKHVKIYFGLTEKKNGKIKHDRSVRFKSVTRLAPGSDIWLYDAEVKDSGGSWEPLCVDDEGERTEAILLGDAWDPTSGARIAPLDGIVTFACRNAALGKCAEWGYQPWKTIDGVSLRDYHQACTRLVRADYCGTGEAHTTNGTPVHVLDPLGIQVVDSNFTYAVEAEWGPNGAVCLNAEFARHPEFSIGCEVPSCGASFASGGLIQSGKVLSGP